MSSSTRLGAIAMAFVLVLSMTTPVVASQAAEIDVGAGNTSFTVTVTHEESPVNDTEVTVSPTDPANASYAGDSGFTDVNGTVTFPLPENETEVNISATVDGQTTVRTTTLPGSGTSAEPSWDGQGPFGQWVTSWLHNLLGPDHSPSLGQTVSEFVTKNNPGSEHRSDKANPGGNGNGPPQDAKNQSDKGNATASGNGNGNDDGDGPPDHANNDNNDDDEEEEDEEEEEEEEEE